MKTLVAAMLIAGSATPVMAADWVVDMDRSTLAFSGTQSGGEAFEGEFEDFTAEISFDPQDLAGSKALVEVDLSSATTGDKQRDAMIAMPVWLDSKGGGTAIFETVAFRQLSDGKYAADGTLMLKDTTNPIVLPFTLDIDGDTAHATGSVVLHRGDWGLGGEQYADDKYVGLDVRVSIDIVATREP